jgi:hypothetical protein
MSVDTLQEPPKFVGDGPQTSADYQVLQKWFWKVYIFLKSAGNNSQQALNLPNRPLIPIAVLGRLAQTSGLAQIAYSRRPHLPARFLRSYVANAQPNPWLIPAAAHGQGNVFTVQCWSGPVVSGGPTGTVVYPEIDVDPSGSGDVTVIYGGAAVGSAVIQG